MCCGNIIRQLGLGSCHSILIDQTWNVHASMSNSIVTVHGHLHIYAHVHVNQWITNMLSQLVANCEYMQIQILGSPIVFLVWYFLLSPITIEDRKYIVAREDLRPVPILVHYSDLVPILLEYGNFYLKSPPLVFSVCHKQLRSDI